MPDELEKNRKVFLELTENFGQTSARGSPKRVLDLLVGSQYHAIFKRFKIADEMVELCLQVN